MRVSVKSHVYQMPVYAFVLQFLNKTCSVVDFGCGEGEKLESLLKPVTEDIRGYDLDLFYRPWGEWICQDLNEEVRTNKLFDVIICADVVEHLECPEVLLMSIKNHSHSGSVIVISTPESSTTRKVKGRPANVQHVQEWLFLEFCDFLLKNGLTLNYAFQYQEGWSDYRYVNNVFICSLKEK